MPRITSYNVCYTKLLRTDVEIYGDLKGNLKTPLIGFVGRATYQKGFDLIFETMPEVVEENNAMFVMLFV